MRRRGASAPRRQARTDRDRPFFADEGGNGLAMVRNILRAHVVLDPVTGAPTHLLTGVCLDLKNPPDPRCSSPYAWKNQPGCDPSFTHVQAINTAVAA